MNIQNCLLALSLALPAFNVSAASAPAPGISHAALTQGGVQRSYRLFVPQGLPPGKTAPLVIAMHGGLGTGDIFAKQTGFDAVAQQQGFLVAYPDGLGRVFNAGHCCGNSQSDDVGFIRALVSDLKGRLPVDAKRVYGMGFSNGSMMAHRVACEAPEVFSAIAAVSGGIMIDGCSSKTPISALLIQGRLDKRILWDGGEFEGTRRPSMAEVVQSIATRNGCTGATQTLPAVAGAECWARNSCPSGARLEWCGLPAVGHQWAGGATYFPGILGPNSAEFDTSARIGAFFKSLGK